MRPYYSLGTARYETTSPEAILVGRSVRWLLAQQNERGTWGGPDTLDEFISTNHVLMTLFSIGVSPDADFVQPALSLLVDVDKERTLSFYWRSGVFLNLEKYGGVVRSDAEFIWANVGRVAVHRDYPIYFFLLKLLRFGNFERDVSFSATDVLSRILADWSPSEGWYGRTSITTMALGLIYDMDFDGKDEIVAKSIDFVLSKYRSGTPETVFHPNLVDDAFVLFNLAERAFMETEAAAALREPVESLARRLIGSAVDGNHWISEPPFGGSIGLEIYPTAVSVRALLAFRERDKFLDQVCGYLIDASSRGMPPSGYTSAPVHPFWGPAPAVVQEDLCFVLMPFQPPKLTEIFERYVRVPIERECDLRCIRADDIHRPTEIMRDVWEHINSARVIVADLTTRNPNVFYELGMAHVLGKQVVLITQNRDDVPFDLSGIRYIAYEDSPSGYENLSKRLVSFIQNLLV